MTTMTKIDTFTESYIACALWSSTGDDDRPLDADHAACELDETALGRMIDDCAEFQEVCASMLDEACSIEGYSIAKAGNDFWLTRNGLGAGFWCRDLDHVGDWLSDVADTFGVCDLYIGDDGHIYHYPA